MPIIGSTPSTPPPRKPNPVEVTRPPFRGVTVDTRYTPVTNLLTHVEGMSWTVNYYSRVLDSDNALVGPALDMNPAYLQYKLIQNFELKVTTPLQSSQNQETKDFTTTGQANVYPCGVIPNTGDLFIADVGDGREAVFQITMSEQRSIYKDSAYIVDYVLINYSDGMIDDMNSKVVENLYYNQDFLMHGQNPLISLSEFEQLKFLTQRFDEILDEYFQRFISKEYSTLIVPGQDYVFYDPLLTSAVLRMFRSTENYHISQIRELNVGDLDSYFTNNIWTAFMRKRRNDLKGSMQHYGTISVRNLTLDGMMESARYSGVEYLVCPTDPDRSEDDIREGFVPTFTDLMLVPTPTRLTRLFDLLSIGDLNGLPVTAPAVNPVSGDWYIFSGAFYNRDSVGQSALELQIQNYLDGKAYDIPAVAQLANSYRSWGMLEQFYQLPFLLGIIQAIIRRM